MRKAIIQADMDVKLQQKKQHIRFLNVAASADVLRPIGAFVSGGKEYEDDSAVPLPSSRFNFIYMHNAQPKQVNWAPYYLVNALHLSPLPEEKLMYGIVQTPKKCLTDRFCDHPTFHLIWSHILDREMPAEHLLASKKVNSFMIDINVNLIGDMNPKDIQFSFLNKDGGDLSTVGVKVADFQELYSAGYTRSKHNPQVCRFYFLGHFKESFAAEQETIKVSISAKQIDEMLVEVPLKRGFSSFLEVQLEATK